MILASSASMPSLADVHGSVAATLAVDGTTVVSVGLLSGGVVAIGIGNDHCRWCVSVDCSSFIPFLERLFREAIGILTVPVSTESSGELLATRLVLPIESAALVVDAAFVTSTNISDFWDVTEIWGL